MTGTYLGRDTAAAVRAGVLLHEAESLQLDKYVADEAAGGLAKVLRHDALPLVPAAVLPPQGSDTQPLLHVHLARQRSCETEAERRFT